jgi:hypothetical protein
MATQPDISPPDTIQPQSPPETPSVAPPLEAPGVGTPEIVPNEPDWDAPGEHS